ncbi:hypothetical protein D6783_00365 [Candidatus Woesearchaeota archaeon]|nr:MAG: hypothetical protein D6783_00365 [Candidatus Woesearchaeota archaeon]
MLGNVFTFLRCQCSKAPFSRLASQPTLKQLLLSTLLTKEQTAIEQAIEHALKNKKHSFRGFPQIFRKNNQNKKPPCFFSN